jgi:hypothetical protein
MSQMIDRLEKIIAAGVTDSLASIIIARQCIEAMQEPTDDMKSVEELHWGYNCYTCGGVKEGWEKMFAEALK